MDPPPPSYAETVGTQTPIITTFNHFSYIRPLTLPSRGRRIGRRLSKRLDIVHIPNPTTSNIDFALPFLHRAVDLFGIDSSIERVAFTMILRVQGRQDILVDEANWEAEVGFLTTPGMGCLSARLVVAVGPVGEVSRGQRLGGLVLGVKRKVVGWSLPRSLA